MSEEEMKALVEMNNMLKHENEKLKQEKKELIKWLKEEIDNPWFINNSYREQELKEVLERLGE